MNFSSLPKPKIKHASPTQCKGFTIEAWVVTQLQSKGLQLLFQNYRSKFGEIDIIMRHKNDLAFIEVRYRENIDLGDPLETITPKKEQKIIRTAEYFLLNHPEWTALTPRFDAISVVGLPPTLKMNWILDAFSVQ